MKTYLIYALVLICVCAAAQAQAIKVNPTGVNVNSQNATVVFLTFGQVPAGYVAAEGMWCGQLIPSPPPALGAQCRPDLIYGTLPARYDLSRSSGNQGLTDIMSIPPSVTRRAYQIALNGGDAGFFYVRRFVSSTGLPDQYVNVTCRMSGGGTRVPFALTDVEIRNGTTEPVLFVGADERFAKLTAEIQYNGTGRLKGRWELVRPGEEPPNDFDLLSEASLPLEDRNSQKRFLQVARFNHFLPPGGKFSLPLEVNGRLPIDAEGQYLLLLRIEAGDDKDSDSDLRIIGVGGSIVHSGAAAGFPMPVFKFFVSSRPESLNWETDSLFLPKDEFVLEGNRSTAFQWQTLTDTSIYKLEFFNEKDVRVYAAFLAAPVTRYQSPSWFNKRFGGQKLKWQVSAIDDKGQLVKVTVPRTLEVR
ncbi:MAG: hypothetical protein ACJ72Z_12270 [Pyrinomonadaceae bacterium]